MNNGIFAIGKLNEVQTRYSEKTSKTYVTAFVETDYSPTRGSTVIQIGMDIPDTVIAEDFKNELLKQQSKAVQIKMRVNSNDYGVSYYAGQLVGAAK